MKIYSPFIAAVISLGLMGNSFALMMNKPTPANTRIVNATQQMPNVKASKGHYLMTSKTIRSSKHPIRMGLPIAKPTAATKNIMHNQRNMNIEE